MNISPYKRLEVLAYEAFIRRAAELDQPFMLKGSYVTRQYFEHPADRVPNDLDWVYLEPIADVATARALFDDWVTKITELPMPDGIVFRSFRENAFWRSIDYAMADDFPTVSTDVECWINGEHFDGLWLDISFNLPIDLPSQFLEYRPLQGDAFLVAHTTPLALQVAWKLHQTLVRPRFKDLFDLLHLVRHPNFTATAQQQALQALRKECRADGTDPGRLRWLLAGDLAPLFAKEPVATTWQWWRHGPPTDRGYQIGTTDDAAHITDATQLPATLAGFQQQLQNAFQQAGFDLVARQLLPPPPGSGVGENPGKTLLDKLRKFL
ncbi:hypothetical protein GCM10027422_26430 [Hymenobacter arcticus]